MAYSLVDGASPHLFSFIFHYIKVTNLQELGQLKLKDPASIEAPQASFHHKGYQFTRIGAIDGSAPTSSFPQDL